MGGKGEGCQEHVWTTHGQKQRGVGSKVGMAAVGGRLSCGGEMETTGLEQQ